LLEDGAGSPKPVKTIPAHFSRVYEATPEDVDTIFGQEGRDKKTGDYRWHIGSPLDMSESVKINLNLNRLVERSSGVFGKSGTGKSFITSIILSKVINESVATCLIFDMHGDYGWKLKGEKGREFHGLRQLCQSRVQVVALDPEAIRHRGDQPEMDLRIGLNQLEPEDVDLLSEMLGLSDVQTGAMYFLRRKLGKNWINELLSDNESQVITDMIEKGQIIASTLGAIQRKFEMFKRFEFIEEHVNETAVEEIFARLVRGTSIVLDFGKYGNDDNSLIAYLLVSNFLTRRIHRRYVERRNKAMGNAADDTLPLVIVIEEAHKFLKQQIAQHTIFGTIARELRKYKVILMIIDQRPSGIDEEVMSQIGTRVTCLLDNEADIRAVFSGVSGASQLREVLARLDTQQQALILGHAVPMPVVVKTREYDEALYAAVGFADGEARKEKRKKDNVTLYGE